jgi:hypothetical protein
MLERISAIFSPYSFIMLFHRLNFLNNQSRLSTIFYKNRHDSMPFWHIRRQKRYLTSKGR